ncbi:hypothetical protein [Pseudomonas sp. NA-150]|uniref:hypothetical protein n=1 Tax=Pseudomonas sp. NA-150 TaxID=3367525 RepID=UPI0037C59A6C
MKFDLDMSVAERRNFIADCELADRSHSLVDPVPHMNSPMAFSIEEPKEPQSAAVAGGTLFGFTEGLSRQNKEDVDNSFLFATLVANKAFNPETETQLWYGKFNQVLSTAGWLSFEWRYGKYRATQRRFSMDQVGLEILGSVIAAAALPGPASLAMLKVAGDAVAALKKSEKPWRMFDQQTKTHQGGSFRVGACSEFKDGTVYVALGAVNFRAKSAVTNVLFWEWNDAEVDTYRGESNMVLNEGIYSGVRDLIRQKLGSNSQTGIMEFEI